MGNFAIFSEVKSAKNVDFTNFARTRYRTQNGGRGVDGRDMPFPAIEHLFKNVNYAPTGIKTYYNSTVL